MDLGGSMHPVWIFQLITTIANWSLQVALSSHEATREHRSVPLHEPGTICNKDSTLLRMFAIGREDGISCPDFVGNQIASKERSLCYHFSPRHGGSGDIRLVLCTRGQHRV